MQQKHNREDRHDYLKEVRDQLLRSDTKRLNCDVSAQLYKKLQIKAIQEDSSITSVVNRLVADYVNS